MLSNGGERRRTSSCARGRSNSRAYFEGGHSFRRLAWALTAGGVDLSRPQGSVRLMKAPIGRRHTESRCLRQERLVSSNLHLEIALHAGLEGMSPAFNGMILLIRFKKITKPQTDA
jgi:hypothetical protein